MIWVVLGLYLLFILTFSIPTIQEYLGRRVASVLSEKLGTSVSIGRLDYDILSHITLYDVLIKDQKGHDMLKAARLSTRLDLLPLAEGKISISTAQLFGVHAKLYQPTVNDKPNFQFVLDSLASKDTTDTSPLNLRINSLIMRRTNVSFDRLDAEETPGIINTNHLSLSDISTHLVLKEFSKDSVNVNIKRLSFKEKSGMEVKRLSLHFAGGRNGSLLTDFRLLMPGTDFSLGDINATYRFRGDHFIVPSLHFSGSIQPSTIRLSDLSYLLPGLKSFYSTLSLEASFRGEGETLEVPKLKISSTTGDIDVNIGAIVQQLAHAQPSWTANIIDLGLSAKTISFISENLQGHSIQVPEEVVRLGNIHLNGIIQGQGTNSLQANSRLRTDAGNVELQMALDSQRNFKGHINTQGFDLKRVLNNEQFGLFATTIQLSGQLPAGQQPTIKADGIVQLLHLNGYSYQNIKLNGLYSARDINGHVSIDDPNMNVDVNGHIIKQRKQNDVELKVDINNLSPKATNLSDKWGDANFSGSLQANFQAENINDAIGTIDIKDLIMEAPDNYYKLQLLHIESGYDEEQHYITMNSDFGEARITGVFDYETLPQSITNFIAAKMPTLPGLPKVNPDTNNNFAIKAYIHKSDWLEQLLQIPLQLTKPLTLEGTVNDNSQQINIECDMPLFYYDDSRYEQGHLSILSPLGTLAYDMSVTKLMGDGDNLDLQITGNAFNNQLTATLQWDDHAEERMSGRVTSKAHFDTMLDGQNVAFINIAPSTITINNTEWSVHPAEITYYDKHLSISNFAIHHDQQYLILDGVASESNLDSISVQMKDLDIDYILDLVNFHAVEFSGLATGGGYIRSVFGEMEADGELTVQQFEFQQGRMGTLHAQVEWNKEKEQIDIHATSDDGPDAQTLIDGYVSPERNFIELGIEAQGTHLDFARSFMSSFISQLNGHAKGKVVLAGPLDHLNITGQLVVNGLAHVTPLGCSYELRNDSIILKPNEITLSHFPVYDINNTEAMMTGAIHHDELTNLTFDLFINANNLLAYHFDDFGTDTFYGTAFASGNVAIRGRHDGVSIDADITPQRGTVFVYNAASPDAINNQEFIQWKSDKAKRSQKAAKTEEDTFRDDLILRMKINTTPNGTIRLLMDPSTNDYITLRGNGIIQATYYNKGSFTMFGTYRVTEGTYGLTIQNIIHKNFTFNEGGTIVFSGDPYDAALNLQAQHVVNGVSLSDLNVGKSFSNTVRVNCLMNITGQPKQPILDFDLEMPNVNADEQQMVRSIINSEEEMNQQVIYLLAVGRFYPQAENNAETTQDSPSKTSLAMQSLLSGTISGQINTVLSRVVKSNQWNFGANISTGDEGWNNAEYEGLISGRLLNNRLLINGQFGYRDKATRATPSFIGDFDIRYLLTPTGNLAMKVYNQSNDRYFTRSSLNTQGVGIIIKKDFNGFSDLFNFKKKKKITVTP